MTIPQIVTVAKAMVDFCDNRPSTQIEFNLQLTQSEESIISIGFFLFNFFFFFIIIFNDSFRQKGTYYLHA